MTHDNSTTNRKTTPTNQKDKKLFRNYPFISAIISILIGSIVMTGWFLNNNYLKSILPGYASMKVNTALLFIIAGLSLLFYCLDKRDVKGKTVLFYCSQASAYIVIIVSVMEISQYLFGWNLHIDQIFINDIQTYHTLVPSGRMALITALNFFLMGISLAVLWDGGTFRSILSQSAVILLMLFSSIALAGFIYNAQAMYNFLPYSAIALHTTLLFIILSLGILSVYPDRAFMKIITGKYFGSMMMRKLLPYIIAIPIILGWLNLKGQQTGMFSMEFGQSLMVILFIVISIIVLWLNAHSLNKIERERQVEKKLLKRAEEEVDLYNNAPCGYHSLDANGLVLQINNTELQWLGYAREEVVNKKTIKELLSPKGNIIFAKNFNEFKHNGYLKDIELEMIRKDGTTFPILLNASAVFDTDGNYAKSRSTLFDLTEQKRFQQSILEANERFSKVFFASPVAMAVTSLTGFIFSDVNEIFLNLFEYKKNEVLGQTAKRLKLFNNSDELLKLKSHQLDNSILRNYEIQMQTKSGKILDTIFSSAIVEIDGVFYQILMIYDNTDHKKSEEELDKYRHHLEQLVEERTKELGHQAKQYKVLFDGNPLPTWIYDSESLKFLAVNETAIDHYQYSKEEFLNMDITEVRPREDVQKILEVVPELKKGKHIGISRHKKKDGTIIDVEINSYALEFEGKQAVLIMINDITERKHAEDAIRDAERRFRTTLDSLLEGCQIIDFNFRYLYCNNVVAEQGHSKVEELIGRTMMEKYPGIESTNLFSEIKRCLEERKPNQLENEFLYPDGTSELFYLSLEPVPEGVFILSKDITKEKQMNEELKNYREHLEDLVKERTAQLEVANKELEAFSYSVSHDLRAPLRHITGFIQILQKEIEADLSENNKRYFGYITSSADKMGVLIDDLLSFSRMGRVGMEKRKVNLEFIITDVLNELSIETKGRVIDWKISSLPIIHGDPSMLKQVILNLISNALKFTKNKDNAVIELGASITDKEHVFYVKDNGAGFDMKYVDKLFGVFQRLHNSNEFEGTGIGLANIKRIITRHGGRVWAEGAVDEGATFYFTIPITKEI
ncbi:MAG: PAS domain S-box protein [Ignavibacteriaceae bacterium]|nr:PAS domain S-box protein [Ignavibacteriaceae bacterium]